MCAQFKKTLLACVIVAVVALAAFQVNRLPAGPLFVATAASAPGQAPTANDELRAFAALEPIDTHVHAFKSDPAVTDLLTRLRLHVLDICVADTQRSFGDLASETARAEGFVEASQHHASLCVTYLHPEHPRKEVILAARDHLLAENPKLRVVGAHLGSMETDVDEIAKRFDRYPNFAVDTAARMEYLMIQPRDKVRHFLVKYQDRVPYGTDLEFLSNEVTSEALKDWQETYSRDWKFLATDQILQYKGHQIEGLDLPGPVLRHIYHDNAARWIPGIVTTSK